MTIQDNIALIKEIEENLVNDLPIRLGVNKLNQLVRLVYEIAVSGDKTAGEVLSAVGVKEMVEEGRNGLFHRVKDSLLRMRYPSIGTGCDPHIMPLKIKGASFGCESWDGTFSPKNIFIEKDVRDEAWTEDFIARFPEAKIALIDKVSDGVELTRNQSSEDIYNARRGNIYLVRNRSAFVKVCPCTKGAKRCGYWILNIGFGCPIDCSYCYLEMYSNAPGLILPANIEEYGKHITEFDDKVSSRTRIGTGEFTDSLALDKYTLYSSYLIPMFRDVKNLELELKTKAADIENVFRQKPHENVIISWSVNTRSMAEKYEKGGASMDDRIKTAAEAARLGFRVGFHFDPVIYYPGWEQEYADIVSELFSDEKIKEKCAWISLGTLRYTPGLKQAAENRFEDNGLFYFGEFFRDYDGKMRYPEKLRIDMYNKMIANIRRTGTKGWIYLCMEPGKVWSQTPLEKTEYSCK